MGRDFTREEDIQESQAMSREKTGRTIRIEDGAKVPVYLLDSHYRDGFAHWIQLPNGDYHRVACGGGEKGEGNAPDDCPICAFCVEQFTEAKRLQKSGRKQESKALWDATRKISGSYEIYFIAVQGDINVAKIEGGKKRLAVEFDKGQQTLLRLTRKQRDDLKSIVNSNEHLTSLKDLFNRWIIIDKRVRGKDEYASLEFIPAPKPTKKPDVEIDEDALEVDDLFKIDQEELKKVLNLLVNGEDEDVELEEAEEEEAVEEEKATIEEETEEEEGISEEIEEEVVDNTEEASDVVSEEEVGESSEVGLDFLDDVDDDFEDDLPYEERDEKKEDEPALPKKGKKVESQKQTPSKGGKTPYKFSKPATKPVVKGKTKASVPAKKPVGKLISKTASKKDATSRKAPRRTDL